MTLFRVRRGAGALRRDIPVGAKLAAKVGIVHARAQKRLALDAWRGAPGRAHGGRPAEVNDVSVCCETFGQRPPVLVLHNGLGSPDMAWGIIKLANSPFVVAPDTRGHGRSTGPTRP